MRSLFVLSAVALIAFASLSEGGCGLGSMRANRHQRIADRVNNRMDRRDARRGVTAVIVLPAAPAQAAPAKW